MGYAVAKIKRPSPLSPYHLQVVSREQVAHKACTRQVLAFAHTFGEAAPNDGFGVWWLRPPHPALAGNTCRWADNINPSEKKNAYG